MRVLDLFSGIGGFSLGLERAGMHTVAFCEIDPYCRAVLRKHWPDVPVYGDVRSLTAATLANTAWHVRAEQTESRPERERIGPCSQSINMADADSERELQQGGTFGQERRRLGDCGIEVICGGFPCQDISVAGRGAGIEGERSGLWMEYARIVGEVRPRYVIVENVAALLGRGLARILGDLAALGYDAEWHCIPASAVGAPHRRDRIWIVAHAIELSERRGTGRRETISGRPRDDIEGSGDDAIPLANTGRLTPQRFRSNLGEIGEPDWWLVESDVGRVADGVPNRVDRLRVLGNAIVPQIAEIIGRAIMAIETIDNSSKADA
jgi:DNA (cytosine-5)-methyltransferase 1